MKVFTNSSDDSLHDGAGLAQAASNPHEQPQGKTLRASLSDMETLDVIPASPSGSWAESDIAAKYTEGQDPTELVAIMTPFWSRQHTQSVQVASRRRRWSSMAILRRWPLEVLNHHQDRRRGVDVTRALRSPQADDGITEADWLEDAHAMFDAVHASYTS